MNARIVSMLVGLVAGVLIGAVVAGTVGAPISGTAVPSHGLATATGCASPDDPRAWVGQVPDSDYRAVYLMNYSFTHDRPDIEVLGNLTEPEPNRWLLAVTATPVDSDKDVPADCQPRTRLDASVAIPTDAESLRITVDGESVVTVETTANAARFHYLNASEKGTA